MLYYHNLKPIFGAMVFTLHDLHNSVYIKLN